MILTAVQVSAADSGVSDDVPDEMLLPDNLGRTLKTPLESVPLGLRPTSRLGLKYQTPATHKGAKLTPEVEHKLAAMQEGLPPFELFPAVPPRLMPYLYSQDELGNTATHPGALIDLFPLEPLIQGAKTALSEHGLRYSLEQTLTYTGTSDFAKGDNHLGNYNADLAAKWAVFDLRGDSGTAGWISTQIEYQNPVGVADQQENVQKNIGSLTNPLGFRSSHNGFRVPELAWQQSFAAGHFVVLAGVINQGNYIDVNAYANTGRGQFINSALINSMVLPLPAYNYGLNLQWQPTDDWYTMLGGSVGNAAAGQSPLINFSWQNWSLEWEIGYAPSDFLSLGPGVYRLQPFLAKAGGSVQGGVGFNFQQQLGRESPFGWFGRFGYGATEVSGGAKAQVGTGFVMQGPLKYAGWVPKLSNDVLGVGFVWSQPSATTKTVYHENEYVLETFYTLQLTPTTRIQPDLQVVWNPAFNPNSGPAVVFQMQFVLAW